LIRLAQREFQYADQLRFASVSGDRNPMHVDALLARRTQAGAPVVHGIHLLLWTLDSLAAAQPDLAPLHGLRVQFSKFVYLNEQVDAILAQQGPAGARLNISVDGAPRLKLSMDFGSPAENCPGWSSMPLEPVPFLQEPLNLTLEQISSRSGSLAFHRPLGDAGAMFPAAAKWLGARFIAALASSTYLVGMVCPGLHSIYSELSVGLCSEPVPQDSLAFRVTEVDPRFRSVEQEIVGGGLTGTVRSFARTPPVRQATMASLAGLVAPQEFAGSLALVVGGSRGLGELTAKLVATGGARVIVTWRTGRDDAEKVAQEIRAAGGTCETLAYDVAKPSAEQLTSLADAPTHIYFFATPPIFRPQTEIFAPDRLQEFLTYYVDGVWKLAQILRARQPKLSVFYPSTVFVEERPKGMTEYAMAKAAGEVLCADINTSLSPMHVTVSRLPRLPTDQTTSVTAMEMDNPIETMLPIIREVQSWPR
jgi:hypothetical protein